LRCLLKSVLRLTSTRDGILESQKKPLESRTWYNYPGQPVYQAGDWQYNEGDTLFRTAAGLRPYLVGRTVTAARTAGPGAVPQVQRVVGHEITAVFVRADADKLDSGLERPKGLQHCTQRCRRRARRGVPAERGG